MSPVELIAPDLVRLAFVLGMVFAVFLYEKTQLTTGSIVVPGFFAIHVFEPVIIFVSLLNAWSCFWLVHRLAPRFCLLQSKTKFHALLIVSVVLQLVWNLVASVEFPWAGIGALMTGFGFVIPGLIGHDMSRNGALKTSCNTLFVSLLVAVPVFGFVVLAPEKSLFHYQTQELTTSVSLVEALVLSTVGAIILKLRTAVRSGGYITAAYVVFFGCEPILLITILLVALATLLLCQSLLIPGLVVFGRRKFAMLLIVGAMAMWIASWLLNHVGMEVELINHPAYTGVLCLLPGLIANGMHRSGAGNVLVGLGVLTSLVIVLTRLCFELKSFARPEYIIPLTGCLVGIFLIIFILHRIAVNANPANPFVNQGATS